MEPAEATQADWERSALFVLLLMEQLTGPCDASPSCNPGDIPITSDEDCLNYPDSCYVNQECGQAIACRRGTDTDADAGGRRGIVERVGSIGYFPFPRILSLVQPGRRASGLGELSSGT